MKKILTVALCLFTLTMWSQSWQWAVRSGGTNSQMIAKSIVSDASGNTYVAGWFVGTVVIGDNLPVTSSTPNEADGYVVKYSSSGNVMWFRIISGAGIQVATGIALDPFNNVCVTGYNSVGANFSGVVVLSALVGYQNGFIVKYSNAGAVTWAKKIGDAPVIAPQTSNTIFANGIAVDAMGYMYVTGSYNSKIQFGVNIRQAAGGAGDWDVFVSKCDNAGNVSWLASAGGTSVDESNSIAVTTNGTTFITGRFFSSTITLGALTLNKTAGWLNDMFVANYSNAGTATWAVKSTGTTTPPSIGMACGNGIATDGSSCYVTGYFTANMNLGSALLSAPGTGADNIFIAKYTSNGSLGWAKAEGSSAGSDVGKCIAYDVSDGRIYSAGYFTGTTRFNNGLVAVTAVGSFDAYFSKYEAATGNFLQLEHAATTSNNVVPNSICKGISGTHTFHSCGYYGGFPTIFYHTLSSNAGLVLSGYTAGMEAAFVAKYTFPTANRMALNVEEAHAVTVYPVPATDNITIACTGVLHDNVVMTLTDINGRELMTVLVAAESGNAQTSFDVSSLAAGIYFVSVIDGDQREMKKIIVGRE
ncbi:hypothetical protein BH11BAC7_BH11BAC7_27230 [soil metagenome]